MELCLYSWANKEWPLFLLYFSWQIAVLYREMTGGLQGPYRGKSL
jgi:hypothetical protein